LRSAKPSWHRSTRPGVVVENRQRVMVFIAGGMTYSEVREAYQLSTALGKEIYIGSTHTFTPRQFIDDLKVVDRGGVGSKAIPKGLPSRGRGQRPYQEYYDEKYLTADAPPPQRPPPTPHVEEQQHGKLTKPSPVSSFTGSVTSSVKDGKEKKKKGLFRF